MEKPYPGPERRGTELKRRREIAGWVSGVAIAAIVILELYALSRGIDGAMLALSFVAISGLGGFMLRDVLPKGR